MHLSRLTLTNLRQFDHRTFEFQPGFNLLVGENGAGKTTILRGLVAAVGAVRKTSRLPWLDDDDVRLRARRAEVTAAVESPNDRTLEFFISKPLWARAERSPRGVARPLVLYYASNEATCSGMKVRSAKPIADTKGEEIRNDEEFLYRTEKEELTRPRRLSPGSGFGNSVSVRSFVGRMLSTFDADFSQFYWRFEPYDCSLVLPRGKSKELVFDEKIEAAVRSAAMRYFHEGWVDSRKRPYLWPDQAKVVLYPGDAEQSRQGENLPNPSEMWRKVGLEIAPETREILGDLPLEVKLTPRIMVQRSIGPLRLSQLSDGEQRLFSLFVDIARNLSLKYPGEEIGSGEAIVLIDEIDVHLHPKWQRQIVPALEDLFSNCQFIASTHSPFVIQATNRQKVRSIDANASEWGFDGGNSIEDIAEEIQGVDVPQRSVRSEKLSKAAEKYFKLLKLHRTSDAEFDKVELIEAEKAYREASEPFTSDPAIHALLKVQLMEGSGS